MINVLTFVAVIGSGLAAGVFFAFSSFVMPGLRRLPAPQGIRAMQAINVTAVRPPFMIDLVGTAVLCAVLAVLGVINLGHPYGPWLLTGGLVYIAGSIGLTRAFHIPRNDALDALDPDAPASADHWNRYQREWNAGNHVRGLLCAVATGLLTAGLLAG
jgi:uncharacterized membrane protein